MSERTTLLTLTLALAACGPRVAWMADESERIAATMRAEPFRNDLPGATGIVLEALPVVPSGGLRYELRSSRDRRSGGGRNRQPPRATRRDSPYGATSR